jgi:hypothetical protein
VLSRMAVRNLAVDGCAQLGRRSLDAEDSVCALGRRRRGQNSDDILPQVHVTRASGPVDIKRYAPDCSNPAGKRDVPSPTRTDAFSLEEGK